MPYADAQASEAEMEAKLKVMDATDTRLREESQELLERLLAEQRDGFEKELAEFKERTWSRNEAEEKERRVEQLRQQALRRMKNGAIIRGWTKWSDQYLERQYLQHRVEEGVRRTHRAWISLGFAQWTYAWHKAREAAIRADALKGYPALEAGLQGA